MVIASEQTATVAHEMSAQEDHFLDVMETLSTSLKHLLLPGSHCNSLGSHHIYISPSLHGRSLGCGGQSGRSMSGGSGSFISGAKVGKAKEKAMRKEKGKGKEKAVEESESGLEVKNNKGT